MIKIQTNLGAIEIELDYEKAPKTAANFEQYVQEGFYDGTIFHRVIDGFMIQGGGFDTGMNEKPTKETVQNEAGNGLKNDTGTVAMARTNDPHSASSQFFINLKDNGFLNHTSPDSQGWGYCVFGKVVNGMDVINQIKVLATETKNGHQDVPVENIIIESAQIIGAEE